MSLTIAEIAKATGATAVGDVDLTIDRAVEPQSAGPRDLAIATSQKYAKALSEGGALAALLWEEADWQALGLKAAILPSRPRFALAALTAMLDEGQGFARTIHPTALVDPAAILGEGVSVGPYAIISAGARIGAGSVIGPQCFIGRDVLLGEDCFLREQASIGARVRAGARLIMQPGSRVGGDGFSFVTPELSPVEATRQSLGDRGETKAQQWTRIHSLGSVTLGDDVEIGSNSTVDAGTIRDTSIGHNTKLDNLVQIGHNAVIGDNCLICAQAGVAGSARIGNNVVLGGHVGVSDNIFVGDGVIAAGGTKLLSNVPAGRSMLGYPGTQMDKQLETYKALRRLPRLLKEVAELRKAVFKTDKGD